MKLEELGLVSRLNQLLLLKIRKKHYANKSGYRTDRSAIDVQGVMVSVILEEGGYGGRVGYDGSDRGAYGINYSRGGYSRGFHSGHGIENRSWGVMKSREFEVPKKTTCESSASIDKRRHKVK